MRFRLAELVDLTHVQKLMDCFFNITNIGSAIIDEDGTELARTGWQDICTKFHRALPETRQRCSLSDNTIKERLNERSYIMYKCLNGLMDCAAPLIVDGCHKGTLITGQFLLEPPDENFFRRQAREFEFDEEAYLAALRQVPVISKERVDSAMAFYSQLAGMLATMGLERLHQLESEKLRFATLIEQAPYGMLLIDANGNFQYINPKFKELFGYELSEIPCGRNWFDRAFPDPEQRREVIKSWKLDFEGILPGEKRPRVFNVTCKNGEIKIIHFISVQLETGEYLVTCEDITQRKKIEETLKHLSLHDSLTGLYNRAYFEQEMCRLESGRYDPVGIIICDVDGLKVVNDSLGHDAGDKLLIRTAGVIKECFRQGDMVARIGGDEFAVLLPKCDESTVDQACNRIREAVNMHNERERELLVSISIGHAVRSDASTTMNNLFKEADNRMYREKLHRQQNTRGAIARTLAGVMGHSNPMDCRILAILEAYEALISDRPYRRAMNHEQAVAEIKRCSGTQFDPYLVDKFVEIIESTKEGKN